MPSPVFGILSLGLLTTNADSSGLPSVGRAPEKNLRCFVCVVGEVALIVEPETLRFRVFGFDRIRAVSLVLPAELRKLVPDWVWSLGGSLFQKPALRFDGGRG